MYAEERQQAMAQLVVERGRVAVTEIAEQFDVTTETVRRDLSALERIGLVRRVHGGAVPASALAVIEAGLGERDQANTDAKDRIAEAALDLLPPRRRPCCSTPAPRPADWPASSPATSGSPSSRTRSRSRPGWPAAPRRPAPAARPGPAHHPGRGRRGHGDALERLRADVAFLGTNGLSIGHGLSTPDRDEASTKRAMVAAARRVVCLADSSKVGTESPIRFAELAEVDVLVTDAGIAAADRRDLERAGVEVVVA